MKHNKRNDAIKRPYRTKRPPIKGRDFERKRAKFGVNDPCQNKNAKTPRRHRKRRPYRF